MLVIFFFFFQAEDGIRDGTVTGVQTCALPILADHRSQPTGQTPAPAEPTGHTRLIQSPLAQLNAGRVRDRKSTRLNSSHSSISYAVFCLKKKKSTACSSLRASRSHESSAAHTI